MSFTSEWYGRREAEPAHIVLVGPEGMDRYKVPIPTDDDGKRRMADALARWKAIGGTYR